MRIDPSQVEGWAEGSGETVSSQRLGGERLEARGSKYEARGERREARAAAGARLQGSGCKGQDARVQGARARPGGQGQAWRSGSGLA
eukprot:348020-Prymnesium_polylepis.1